MGERDPHSPEGIASKSLIAAIVLAAGRSTRMGKQKLSLPIGGETMLERVVRSLRESQVDEVVLVLREGADELTRTIDLGGVRVVVNRAPEKGMGGSLKLGLKEVENDAEGAIIALGDQPFVSPATVNSLVEAFKEKRARIVVPVYMGTRGNPVLFSREFFPEMMLIEGDKGAKSIVNRHANEVQEVKVDDQGVIFDVDTPEDYRRAAGLVS